MSPTRRADPQTAPIADFHIRVPDCTLGKTGDPAGRSQPAASAADAEDAATAAAAEGGGAGEEWKRRKKAWRTGSVGSEWLDRSVAHGQTDPTWSVAWARRIMNFFKRPMRHCQ